MKIIEIQSLVVFLVFLVMAKYFQFGNIIKSVTNIQSPVNKFILKQFSKLVKFHFLSHKLYYHSWWNNNMKIQITSNRIYIMLNTYTINFATSYCTHIERELNSSTWQLLLRFFLWAHWHNIKGWYFTYFDFMLLLSDIFLNYAIINRHENEICHYQST